MQFGLKLAVTWPHLAIIAAAVAGLNRLLKEDGTTILLENGDFLLLE